MQGQDWQGKVLDKDYLGNGKLYSPDTCRFISSQLNVFMNKRTASRGDNPIGVCFDSVYNKYRAQCGNPDTGKKVRLGSFDTPQEAFIAWANKKHEFANMLADREPDQDIKAATKDKFSLENLLTSYAI